jgi:hypothetical protein
LGGKDRELAKSVMESQQFWCELCVSDFNLK